MVVNEVVGVSLLKFSPHHDHHLRLTEKDERVPSERQLSGGKCLVVVRGQNGEN